MPCCFYLLNILLEIQSVWISCSLLHIWKQSPCYRQSRCSFPTINTWVLSAAEKHSFICHFAWMRKVPGGCQSLHNDICHFKEQLAFHFVLCANCHCLHDSLVFNVHSPRAPEDGSPVFTCAVNPADKHEGVASRMQRRTWLCNPSRTHLHRAAFTCRSSGVQRYQNLSVWSLNEDVF